MPAEYPNNIFNQRTIANVPGVVYDAAKTKVVFAEDIQALGDEVTAIEETLGENPEGSEVSVVARLDAIDAELASIPYFVQGFYTPTYNGEVNIASFDSTPDLQYIRIGNRVTVFGLVFLSCSGTDVFSAFRVNLPEASDLGNDYELAGVCSPAVTEKVFPGPIYGDTGHDEAYCTFNGGNGGTSMYSIYFSYLITG